jgi:hypothetical protein
MNYTQKETEDWKARFGKKKSFRPAKRRPDQLPGNILIVDAKTGEYKEVKPVSIKTKIKKRRSKKRVKK